MTDRLRPIARACTLLGAIFLFAASPTMVSAQSSGSMCSTLSDIQRRSAWLRDDSPGSWIVYHGCESAAEDQYRQTRQVSDGLGVLTTCAALGCAFTDSYSNCLAVGTELFILHLRQTDLLSRLSYPC